MAWWSLFWCHLILMRFTRRGRVSPTPGELVRTPHDGTSMEIIFIIYVIFIWVYLEYWISSLFSLGMDQFSASWFVGEDGLILIVHGSPERSCSSLIRLFWRLTWIHLLPTHLYLLSPAHMSVNRGTMLNQWACGLMELILMSLDPYELYSTRSSFSHPRGVGANTTR